ncbi:MAG: SDR family oxidoreductase [Ignavibacteriae bacterium]|nr:SDR family oxidoreductase [Ignavibacteriota bacterium]
MGKVLITGSGRRIGRGLAIRFAEKGWDVIIHFNSSENKANETLKHVKSLGVNAVLIKADVRFENEIIRGLDIAVKEVGIPDVLINNAGVYPPETPLNQISGLMWDDTININLRGEYLFSKIYAGKANEGRIINFASLGGLEVWNHRIPYNVSKAGVIQLTKALSKELAPNFAVNCICPGTIDIPDESPSEIIRINKDKIPMKRYGNIDDIFDAVYFFSTCSKYITGQILCVDGGFHIAR